MLKSNMYKKKVLYVCENCDKTFKRKWDLQCHLNRKTSCDRDRVCPHCKMEFNYPYLLARHLKLKKSCIKSTEFVKGTLEFVKDINDVSNNDNTIIIPNQDKIINTINNTINNTVNNTLNNNTTINNNTINISININNGKEYKKLCSNDELNKLLTVLDSKNLENYDVDQIKESDTTKLVDKSVRIKDFYKKTVDFIGELLFETYIKNTPFEHRAVFCTSHTRNKYLLYIDNEWEIDWVGEKFMEKTTKLIVERLKEIFRKRLVDIANIILEYEDKDYKQGDDIFLPELGFECTCLMYLNEEHRKLFNFIKDLETADWKYYTSPLKQFNGYIVYKDKDVPDEYQMKCLEKYVQKEIKI